MLQKSSIIALIIIFSTSVLLGFPLFRIWQKHSFSLPNFLYPETEDIKKISSKNNVIFEKYFFSAPYARAQAGLAGSSAPRENLNRPLEPWEKDFLKCLCGGYRLNWVCCRVYGKGTPEAELKGGSRPIQH